MNEDRSGDGTRALAEMETGTRMRAGQEQGRDRGVRKRDEEAQETAQEFNDVEYGGDFGGTRKNNVDKKGFVQQLPTQII